MGILDALRKKKSSSAGGTFRLTQEGEAKLQDGVDDTRSQVLLGMSDTHSSKSVDEISRSSGIPPNQVATMMPGLVRQGYVQRVGADDVDED